MKKVLIISMIAVLGVGAYFVFFSNSEKFSLSDIFSNPNGTPSFPQNYADPESKFNFGYPDGFRVTEQPATDDLPIRKVVVESAEPLKGFEISIFAFDEPGPLTEERIKQDLPDITMSDIVNMKIGGTDALAFNSVDESLGKTYEVWLIYGGELYQIRTYLGFKQQMGEIVKTWNFM